MGARVKVVKCRRRLVKREDLVNCSAEVYPLFFQEGTQSFMILLCAGVNASAISLVSNPDMEEEEETTYCK